MRTLALIFGSVLLLVSGASAQPPAGKGYDAFHLVQTRNIFDPARRANRVEAVQQRTQRNDGGSRNRASSLTLTGTMVRDGKSLAFFSGTRSELSKVLPVGEPIGNFKVTAITSTNVELQGEGKTTTLEVGRTLPLEGPAEAGTLSTSAEEAPATNVEASPQTSSGAPASPAVINDKTEILRRLMEKRAKEMNK